MSSTSNFWDPENVKGILLEGITAFFPTGQEHLLQTDYLLDSAVPRSELGSLIGTMNNLERALSTLRHLCRKESCAVLAWEGPVPAPEYGPDAFHLIDHKKLDLSGRLSSLERFFMQLLSASLSRLSTGGMGVLAVFRKNFEITLGTPEQVAPEEPVVKVPSEKNLGEILTEELLGLLEPKELKDLGPAEFDSKTMNYIGKINDFELVLHTTIAILEQQEQSSESEIMPLTIIQARISSLLFYCSIFTRFAIDPRQNLIVCKDGKLATEKVTSFSPNAVMDLQSPDSDQLFANETKVPEDKKTLEDWTPIKMDS